MSYFRILYSLLLVALVGGCGSTPSSLTPELPSAGTEHLSPVATSAVDSKSKAHDPWLGKQLIAPPTAKAPTALVLPDIQRFTLKNGLQVIAVQDSSLPVTTLQLAIKSGKRQVPREKIGLAELAAQAMTRGTRRRNAAAIAKAVEAVGGELRADANYEATLFSCKSLSHDLRTCLSVLPDVVVNPNFPKSELDLVRRNLLASVRQRLDDAGQLASAHFQSALWGDSHARGWVMSPLTIQAISQDDVRAWHKEHIVPNNSVLAISGDFDAKRIQKDLERAFGHWRKAEIPKTPSMNRPTLQGLRIRLVDKPGESQAHIRMGHLGIAHSDPDFYAALAFDYSLGGGGFSSRLMQVMRSEAGKVYTVSSHFDRNREVGSFLTATFTRSAEAVATVKLMQQGIAGMAKMGPTTEELQAATTNISGSYAMRFETSKDVASALLAAHLHGFGNDYVRDFPLKVAAVSQPQAAKAAARILSSVNAVLVIVGDAKQIGPQLAAAGWAFEQVSFREPISNWERAKVENTGTAKVDPQTMAAARTLLDAALTAKGGAKRLRDIKSFHWQGDATLHLPTGAMAATVEKHFMAPDSLRLDMVIGGGQVKIVTALSKNKGWALEKSPKGERVRDFAALELTALSGQLWRDSELVLLRHLDTDATLSPLGERQVAGKTVVAIGVSKGGRSVILLIDLKSKMLVGMDYADQGMKTSERFEDYKNVQGIPVAHTRSTKGPQVDLLVKLTHFEVDKAVAPTLFVRPTHLASPSTSPPKKE